MGPLKKQEFKLYLLIIKTKRMRAFIKKLFGAEKANITELLNSGGAMIIDVRSEREFAMGNVKGSVNIPLKDLSKHIDDLKEKQPLVLCCASGMRSSSGVSELRAAGIDKVFNGGSWQKVNIQKK